MQKAQRCWQPSWIFTKGRDRPVIRVTGATGTERASRMSATATAGRARLTSESSRSGSRYFS